MTDRKPYRPSNGTEGFAFINQWCGHCKRDRLENGSVGAEKAKDEDLCPIIAASFMHDIDEPEYPFEWIYDADNRPCCTAFEDAGAPDGLSVVDDRTADLFGGDR